MLRQRDDRMTGTLSPEPREGGDAGTQGRGVGSGACVPAGFAVVRCPVRLSVGSGESRPVDTEPAPSEEHLRGAEAGSRGEKSLPLTSTAVGQVGLCPEGLSHTLPVLCFPCHLLLLHFSVCPCPPPPPQLLPTSFLLPPHGAVSGPTDLASIVTHNDPSPTAHSNA